MASCIERGGEGPPDKIIDSSTLNIALDNQGNAVLQITILDKSSDFISNNCFVFPLGDKKFRGFIDSDNPRKFEGSEYFEHNITARGYICDQ